MGEAAVISRDHPLQAGKLFAFRQPGCVQYFMDIIVHEGLTGFPLRTGQATAKGFGLGVSGIVFGEDVLRWQGEQQLLVAVTGEGGHEARKLGWGNPNGG